MNKMTILDIFDFILMVVIIGAVIVLCRTGSIVSLYVLFLSLLGMQIVEIIKILNDPR